MISFLLQLFIYFRPLLSQVTDSTIISLLKYDGFRSKALLDLPILIYLPLLVGLIASVGLFEIIQAASEMVGIGMMDIEIPMEKNGIIQILAPVLNGIPE